MLSHCAFTHVPLSHWVSTEQHGGVWATSDVPETPLMPPLFLPAVAATPPLLAPLPVVPVVPPDPALVIADVFALAPAGDTQEQHGYCHTAGHHGG